MTFCRMALHCLLLNLKLTRGLYFEHQNMTINSFSKEGYAKHQNIYKIISKHKKKVINDLFKKPVRMTNREDPGQIEKHYKSESQ